LEVPVVVFLKMLTTASLALSSASHLDRCRNLMDRRKPFARQLLRLNDFGFAHIAR
jgi:hypothetical protein